MKKKIRKLILSKNFAHFGKFLDFWRFSKKLQGNLLYFDRPCDDFRKNYKEISCILTDHGGSLVLHVLCYSLPPTPNTHRPPNHPHPPTPKSHTTPRSTNTQSYKYYSNDQLRYGNSNVIFQHFRRHCVIKLLVLHLKCFSLNKMNQFELKKK